MQWNHSIPLPFWTTVLGAGMGSCSQQQVFPRFLTRNIPLLKPMMNTLSRFTSKGCLIPPLPSSPPVCRPLHPACLEQETYYGAKAHLQHEISSCKMK